MHKIISQIPTARRLALTGTPMQNNLFELFALIELIVPGGTGTAGRRVPAIMADLMYSRNQEEAAKAKAACNSLIAG